MAFCQKCGTELQERTAFCPTCGTAVNVPQAAQATNPQPTPVANINQTPATEADDIKQNIGMSVLAYLGLLWLIPYFCRKDSPYTQYHCKQGLTLLVIELGYSVLSLILSSIIKTKQYVYGIYIGSFTPGWLTAILSIGSIALIVFAVIGIINAATGKKAELPLIGKYKILK